MKKTILLLLLFIPFFAFAQNEETVLPDTVFKARVIEILEEKTTVLPNGTESNQQNIKLKALEGKYEGKDLVFNGIGDYDVLNKNTYKEGDKVLVVASQNAEGDTAFFITGFVRTDELFYLFLLFVIILVLVGRTQGFRSIISLVVTFIIILKYLIPQILSGASPLIVTLISSFAIILIIIYITEGFKAKAHISVVSTFLCLLIAVFVSWIFVELARLTGFAGEEMAYLVNINSGVVNFKGLLLAGVIIGALGVLDDVIISQVVAVEQLHKTDEHLSKKELFSKAYQIGISHISSMTNTLFLAYAGASLPLLILFISGKSAFSSFSQVVNNEVVATEIVRTLAGSISLIMAVPIATYVAVLWFKQGK